MKHLILGGARSGKSHFAEQSALALYQQRVEQFKPKAQNELKLHYVATATAEDEEMVQRIAHHAKQRSPLWTLTESPLALAKALHSLDQEGPSVILVDCLTLWLSNALQKKQVQNEIVELLAIVEELKSDIFFVSNEVGSGIVPLGQLSREFVDHAGRLHQALAKACNEVTLIVAGLPLSLKRDTSS